MRCPLGGGARDSLGNDEQASNQHAPVSDTVDALILDLLEWVGPEPRPYAEVLEAWRTSCPRLPVWEDANDRGFVARRRRAVLAPEPCPGGSWTLPLRSGSSTLPAGPSRGVR